MQKFWSQYKFMLIAVIVLVIVVIIVYFWGKSKGSNNEKVTIQDDTGATATASAADQQKALTLAQLLSTQLSTSWLRAIDSSNDSITQLAECSNVTFALVFANYKTITKGSLLSDLQAVDNWLELGDTSAANSCIARAIQLGLN